MAYVRSIHLFPRDDLNINLNKSWKRFVRRTKKKWKGRTKNAYICSDHFNPDCFENWFSFDMKCSARLVLKPGSVPTIYPDGTCKTRTAGHSITAKDPSRTIEYFECTPEVSVVDPSTGMQVSLNSSTDPEFIVPDICTATTESESLETPNGNASVVGHPFTGVSLLNLCTNPVNTLTEIIVPDRNTTTTESVETPNMSVYHPSTGVQVSLNSFANPEITLSLDPETIIPDTSTATSESLETVAPETAPFSVGLSNFNKKCRTAAVERKLEIEQVIFDLDTF